MSSALRLPRGRSALAAPGCMAGRLLGGGEPASSPPLHRGVRPLRTAACAPKDGASPSDVGWAPPGRPSRLPARSGPTWGARGFAAARAAGRQPEGEWAASSALGPHVTAGCRRDVIIHARAGTHRQIFLRSCITASALSRCGFLLAVARPHRAVSLRFRGGLLAGGRQLPQRQPRYARVGEGDAFWKLVGGPGMSGCQHCVFCGQLASNWAFGSGARGLHPPHSPPCRLTAELGFGRGRVLPSFPLLEPTPLPTLPPPLSHLSPVSARPPSSRPTADVSRPAADSRLPG